jgi:phosphoesterase RecJ-like protein
LIQKDLDRLTGILSDKTVQIVLTTHKSPDGDAIGSMLALYGYLRKLALNVSCIVPDAYPNFFKWLPNNNAIKIFDNEKEECINLIENSDILFSLDYNAYHRTGKMEEHLNNTTATKILIDHHLEPDNCFDISFSEINTSSTSELVYEIIEALGNLQLLNKDIAEALYVGIMTDTGSFSYACNYKKTFQIIAHLIELGVNGEKIHQLVYSTFTESRLRLLGFCLSKRLVVIKNAKAAYIYLSKEDLKEYKYKSGDTEGVVNYALTIKGIEVAALFTERDNFIRISLRSKGNFSVNNFARQYFDGGGHKKAAGGNSYLNMKETLKQFEVKISEEMSYKS